MHKFSTSPKSFKQYSKATKPAWKPWKLCIVIVLWQNVGLDCWYPNYVPRTVYFRNTLFAKNKIKYRIDQNL